MFRLILAAALLFSSWHASASQSALEQFFSEVKTLEADFEQRVKDERGSLIEFSKGKLSLARPGRFRWDYASLEADNVRGQQIVADGQSIYMYDPDLEQVTQRSMADALMQVPSLVLVQHGSNIKDHFKVNDIGKTDGLEWVALRPISEDAGYQQLMIGFKADKLTSIMLLDVLGNETELMLSNVVNNRTIADSRFNFIVPEGADVLSE